MQLHPGAIGNSLPSSYAPPPPSPPPATLPMVAKMADEGSRRLRGVEERIAHLSDLLCGSRPRAVGSAEPPQPDPDGAIEAMRVSALRNGGVLSAIEGELMRIENCLGVSDPNLNKQTGYAAG